MCCTAELNLFTCFSASNSCRQERVSGDDTKAAALARIICRQPILELLQRTYRNEPSRAVDEGLKRIMTALMERKARHSFQKDRLVFLRRALGFRFEEAMSLVNDIHTTRLNRVKLGCGRAQCLAPQDGNRSSSPRLCEIIPMPVKRLFFLNRLYRAVNELPVSKLSEQDWDALILEARSDLLEYHAWRTQGQIISSDSDHRQDDSSSDESAISGTKRSSLSDDSAQASWQRNVRRRSGSV